MSAIVNHLHKLWMNWYEFWVTFHLLRRIDDLKVLARWAKRKRLKGPYQAYRHKLLKELLSLQGQSIYYPELTW